LNKAIFIIGVSGSGKSTIGKLLSEYLNLPFFDGDDYHSNENIAKMSKGIPLNDQDRYGWLQSLNRLANGQLENNSCIIVCSALKQSYRDILSEGIEGMTKWVHLHGTFEQIAERINNRKGHFMTSDLLKSQFDILEDPKEALQIDISKTPNEIVETINDQFLEKSDIGLFGLGVMGKSLSRNLAQKGFEISMYNRHITGLEENVAKDFKLEFEELSAAIPFDDVKSFVHSIQKPRKIMLMVKAGKTIDLVIGDLLPHLSEGDILIDGGNSNYNKTKERIAYLKSKKVHFIGVGISGGEEGALKGPSIMAGGNRDAYIKVKHFLEAIVAKDINNLPCCTYIGNEGAGHFVKMVHNGIEYVEMQLLAEVFGVLKAMNKNPDEIADILASWKNMSNSYLLEITIDILRKKENNDWLINKIIDKADNKGTGNWANIASAELGTPSTLIASALFARFTSFYKEDRVIANLNFSKKKELNFNLEYEDILNAYQFARIINHYQGFSLLDQASNKYEWHLNLSEIARIWTNGCIIKSELMRQLVKTLKTNSNILADKEFIQQVSELFVSSKKVVSQGVLNEISIPCMSDSINFFNAYKTAKSSANLMQAQRDYFGAHSYQRTDDASGIYHHTNWKNK